MRGRLAVLGAVAALAGASAGVAAGYAGFWTPSKNIACAAFGGTNAYLRCDVLSGMRPEPAARCELDWTGFTVRLHGRAEPTCAGDTVAGLSKTVLAYGKTWRAHGFTCVSKAVGLRCWNQSRHGFFLSRQHSYRF